MGFELRPYQREAVDSINNYWVTGQGENPVLVEPTGAGKSVMLACYIAETFPMLRPGSKIMVMAHVKELLEQNHAAIVKFDQSLLLNTGLYSAGLNRKDTHDRVIVAGIQSAGSHADKFGHVSILIVDECHLINPKQQGLYRKFIADLKKVNPQLKIVGFTASPYRLTGGYIYKKYQGFEPIFDGVAHETTIMFLIENGFLVKPIAKNGGVHADLSQVHTRMGDYVQSEVEEAFDPIISEAVKDVVARSKDRKAAIVFCSSVDHAEKTAEAFRAYGEQSVQLVSGGTSPEKRRQIVNDVKAGRVRWLINVGVFTTGFDAPNIDTVVFLIATQSTVKYVQCIGRGLRLHTDKTDCLILDYGENVQRHGPLDDLQVREPGQKKKKEGEQLRAKCCPMCESLVSLAARICPNCEWEFPVEERGINHGTEAADVNIIGAAEPEWQDVIRMMIYKHTKPGGTDSMRVSYALANNGGKWIDEWICFDHEGFAKRKSTKWAERRGFHEMSLQEALETKWPRPAEILVKKNGKYHEIIDARFPEQAEFEEVTKEAAFTL